MNFQIRLEGSKSSMVGAIHATMLCAEDAKDLRRVVTKEVRRFMSENSYRLNQVLVTVWTDGVPMEAVKQLGRKLWEPNWYVWAWKRFSGEEEVIVRKYYRDGRVEEC